MEGGRKGKLIHARFIGKGGRIPAETLAEIIAVADTANDALAAILKFQSFSASSLGRIFQHDGNVVSVGLVPVFSLAGLKKLEGSILRILDRAYAEIGIEREQEDRFSAVAGLNGCPRGGVQVGVVREAGVYLVTGYQEILAGGRGVINVAGIAVPRGKVHPNVLQRAPPALPPAAHAEPFQVHGVIPALHPPSFLRL